MLSKPEIDAAATRLVAAEKTRVQTGLLSLLHPAMTMDDAYAVQAAFVAKKTDQPKPSTTNSAAPIHSAMRVRRLCSSLCGDRFKVSGGMCMKEARGKRHRLMPDRQTVNYFAKPGCCP